MRKFFGVAAAVLMASAVSVSAMADDKLKVGFIYIGPPGDHGWTYQHDQGRIALVDAMGDKVTTVAIENVPESQDAERTITRLARQGAGLIFTTSFGYMEPTIKVAEKFPEVKFEHATGYMQADNVSTYSARFYEGPDLKQAIGLSSKQVSTVGLQTLMVERATV
jgi:basic membrane protein A